MFTNLPPEASGISSLRVKRFIKALNDNGLTMHSVLLLRGNNLFGEYYWSPFNREFCHRMYSQTKSYVSVAIGLLEEEGKINIDSPIIDYFPEKLDIEPHEYIKKQTIRNMLTMTTSVHAPNWFKTDDPDRVHEYFNSSKIIRPAGAIFDYDSTGSQVLCALVEKLSGMTLFEYLNKKIFSELGTFRTAKILKTTNGDSWGDSALLCRPLDMMSFAKFVMNYGLWHGKRLMNENYLKKATSKQVDSNETGFMSYDSNGYGYLFWRHNMNGFSFNGMGGQYTVCVPEKDFIFSCTADNQGYVSASSMIFGLLKELIVSELGNELPYDKKAYEDLLDYTSDLKLAHICGYSSSEIAPKLNRKTFICEHNKCGIKKFSFDFDNSANIITWTYENEQGQKSLQCGVNKNCFDKFPQYGYSNEIGGVKTTDGYLYDCASSAAWIEKEKLGIKIQIIDKYLGNIMATFSFKDSFCAVKLIKHAESFLDEYQGEFVAHLENYMINHIVDN